MTIARLSLQQDAEGIGRVSLALLPTPLQQTPRLAAALGLRSLCVKRDDCTGLGPGGTKARALDYLMAEALEDDVDTVLTYGAAHSNHTALTAAAAARSGLQCILYQTGEAGGAERGNQLLAQLSGAELVPAPEVSPYQLQLLIQRRAEALRAVGRHPVVIPLGGATPTSCIGYVRAVQELASQLQSAGLALDAIVVAAGSGGTLAGLTLGARMHLPDVAVLGFSVGPTAELLRRRTTRLIADTAVRLGLEWSDPSAEVRVSDEWIGQGYGIPTAAAWEAVDTAARTEGLLLDPLYTGKALAGLRGLVADGTLAEDARVTFWHTGGVPALFGIDRAAS